MTNKPHKSIQTPTIQVLAFDFDGVLADSLPTKDRALKNLFQSYGPQVEEQALATWNRYKGVFRPKRLQNTFQETVNVHLEGEALDSQVQAYADQIFATTIAAPWIPGVKEFLEKNRQIPCYVVSAAPEKEVREIVKRRTMSRFFKNVYGGPEKKTLRLQSILKQEQCPSSKLLFLGDSISDYVAAEQVEVSFLGVVKPGLDNPFPESVTTVPDLTQLKERILGHHTDR